MTTKAEVIASVLEDIYARRGELTPEHVVTEAAAKDHPLHGFFTWDDTEAARRYRIGEARGLIRSVKIRVVTDEDQFSVRSWVSSRDAARETPGYMPEAEVRVDPAGSEALRKAMRRDFLAMRRRYQHLEEFWSMVREEVAGAEAQAS